MDRFYVKCSYEHCRTCNEYSTLWMTYTCGNESIRKRVRIWHHYFNNIWCFERDVWGFLRERVGKEFDARAPMTKKELLTLLKSTNHFNSEDWSDSLSSFVWKYEYNFGHNSYKELEEKYDKQCKIDKSVITSEHKKI